MPLPAITPDNANELATFIQALLVSTKDTPTAVLLNGLMSAYFSAAVNRGYATDVPAALRAAADTVERQLEQVITAKALIEAHGATKN